MHLKVAVSAFAIYMVTQKGDDGRDEVVGGIDLEFVKILASILNFTYEFITPSDYEWGRLKDDGTWSGMVGMLDRKEADMAISCVTLSYDRSTVTDFAFPYQMDYDTFAIKKAGAISRSFFFVHTFDLPVWIGIGMAFLVCSFLLTCLESFEKPVKKRKRRHLLISMFLAAEKLIGSQGTDDLHKKTTTKLYFTWTTLHIQTLQFCFTGLLLSLLMTPIIEHQIQTIEELAKESKAGKVKVTSYKDTQLATDLMIAKTSLIEDLGQNLRKNPETAAAGDEDVIKRISSGYSFMDIRDYMDIVISEAGIEDGVFISTDSLRVAHIAILFKKGFCCTKEFDKMVIRYYQSGIYQKLLQDQLFKLRLKGKLQAIAPEPVRPIAMKDIIGVLVLLSVGYGLAFLALICEKIVNKS